MDPLLTLYHFKKAANPSLYSTIRSRLLKIDLKYGHIFVIPIVNLLTSLRISKDAKDLLLAYL